MKKGIILALLSGASFLLIQCSEEKSKVFADKESEEGYKLAQKYCQSCHLLTEPTELNKVTWAYHVLPKMGSLLGFRSLGMNKYISSGSEVMKLSEWKKIVHYYLMECPEQPIESPGNNIEIKANLPGYKMVNPDWSVQPPITTLVSFDSASKKIYVGDGMTGNLYVLNKELILENTLTAGTGIVNLKQSGDSYKLLTMGTLQPTDNRTGQLIEIEATGKNKKVIIDSLQRPVHANYKDLNGDQLEDIVVCEFGNTTGQLSWFQQTEGYKFIRNTLRAKPGAVKTEITDLDADGRPDIIALMAQADEGVFVYYNEGNGKFREERVIGFPPTYGSNYFELVDINRDGYADIVTSNGDNGDYPPIPKSYHGIRIFLNDGKNKFVEKYFLPMNGVGKALVKDFDRDGDYDIAAISFFPVKKEERFIFWENKGGFEFAAKTFNDVLSGSWLTMDCSDLTGDGKPEIILGNLDFGKSFGGGKDSQQQENKTVKKPSVVMLVSN